MTSVYRLKYLRGRRLAVFLAAADRIIPADEDAPGGGSLTAAGIVDWALERVPPDLRRQFLALLVGIEVLGIFFGGRLFSSCSASAQDRGLAWLERCPLRALRLGFFGLKSYVCLGYYSQESIWETIDYEGPILAERPFPDPWIRGLCRGEVEVQQ